MLRRQFKLTTGRVRSVIGLEALSAWNQHSKRKDSPSPVPAREASLCLSVELCVQVILLAEFVCEGYTGKELAPLALDGVEIEQNHKS